MAVGDGRKISLGAKHPKEMTVAGEIVSCNPKAHIRILEWPVGSIGPSSRTPDHRRVMHLGQEEN